jgi:hypothetical protein
VRDGDIIEVTEVFGQLQAVAPKVEWTVRQFDALPPQL